jgi:hypothetical protein
MTDEDINWFEGKYPSWEADIERSAKAAIDEIHRMAIEAMPKTPYLDVCNGKISDSQSQYNLYANIRQYQNLGMQGQSYSGTRIPYSGLF